MSESASFADAMAAWAARMPSVKALVLFGSRAHGENDPIWSADTHSDWDFQIITSDPKLFSSGLWLRDVTRKEILAYAVRVPRVGGMPKINSVLVGAEADFVILPARVLALARIAVNLGLHRRPGRVRRSLQDLSLVIRPGFRFLKGAETWEAFYRRVVRDVPDPRLDDAAIRNLAEAFVCDYLWAIRKLNRGELLAVQRILHRELAETNFRLRHELSLREGRMSFPEARRLERFLTSDELSAVSVDSPLQFERLRSALEQSAASLRAFVGLLVGEAWQWPKILPFADDKPAG